MSKTRYTVVTIPDFKNDVGDWCKGRPVVKSLVYGKTRSHQVWDRIRSRLKEGGFASRHYSDVSNTFESYQAFANWCQTQYGYMEKDGNGRYWSIDKDIKPSSDRNYSPENCMFIPHYINTSIVDSKDARGEYPIGVHFVNKKHDMVNILTNCYNASVKKDSKRVYLGYYPTPMLAHAAWQKAKIEILTEYKNRVDIRDHCELQSAMTTIIDRLKNDLELGLETKCLLGRE